MLEVSAEEALLLKKKERKAKQDLDAKRRQREREKVAKARTKDTILLSELESLDETEEYYHKSECRSRVELYDLYLEHAAGKPILKTKKRSGTRSFKEWLRLRDFYRKHLYHLGKFLLNFPDLNYRVHNPVCKAFVKKNFNNTYHKTYGLKDIREAFWRMRETRLKNALILDPRGFLKTSINTADIVQWIINCPDVKILLLTAEHKRANDILVAVKRFFFKTSDELTDFQLIYPEFIIEGVEGSSKEPLDCPARKESLAGVDHTFSVKSQSSQKTGTHPDVGKRDDIVTPENATTPDLRKAVKESADDTANLVLEHGFLDTIGTRYAGGDDPDYYGVMLQRLKESPAGEEDLVVFLRSCWTVKPEYASIKLKELTFEMVDLVWPEQGRTPESAFKSLRRKLIDNERSFRNQQLNEPIDDAESSFYIYHFDIDTLRHHTGAATAFPSGGEVCISFDTAGKSSKNSDFTCGVAGRLFEAQPGKYGIIVTKVIYGKLKSTDIAISMVDLYNEFRPWMKRSARVEDAAGSDTLKEKVKIAALQRGGRPVNYIWVTPSNKPDAKRNRIRGLDILIQEGRLKFVSGSWIDELYKQFSEFTGERGNKKRKDDIPDAIAYLVDFLPAASRPGIDAEQIKKEEDELREEAQRKAVYDSIFNTPPTQKPGLFAPPIPVEQSAPTKSALYQQAINKVFGRNMGRK
jgi:hypothetical protein